MFILKLRWTASRAHQARVECPVDPKVFCPKTILGTALLCCGARFDDDVDSPFEPEL